MLVCESAKINLLDAATAFLRKTVQRDHVSGPRNLPNRVRQLIAIGDRRRTDGDRTYSDFAFWDGESDIPDNISGLIVVQDLRV